MGLLKPLMSYDIQNKNICKTLNNYYIFSTAEGSPFVVPDDTDGLVRVCCPGDRPLGNNLAQGEESLQHQN